MRGGPSHEGVVVTAYALILNAGSSSLKFCVYLLTPGVPWQVDARGQIEGIGTSPHLAVKDARGTKLVDNKLATSVRDGRAAIDTLSEWLRSRYQGGRIVGVGHRVVHGGPRFSRPMLMTRETLAELKE